MAFWSRLLVILLPLGIFSNNSRIPQVFEYLLCPWPCAEHCTCRPFSGPSLDLL